MNKRRRFKAKAKRAAKTQRFQRISIVMDDAAIEFFYGLSRRDYEAMLAAIENPTEPNEALRRLMATPAPWEARTPQELDDNGLPLNGN